MTYGIWPRLYLILRHLSPVIALVGTMGGALFVMRSSQIGPPDEAAGPIGLDLVFIVAAVFIWLALTVALANPPDETLAASERLDSARPLIVWLLGRQWRFWNSFAAPVTGCVLILLAGMATSLLIRLPTAAVGEQLLLLVACVCITVPSVLVATVTIRTPRVGVELEAMQLVARGFLRTRRFPRASIRAAEAAAPSRSAALAFHLLRVDTTAVPRLLMRDGSTFVLTASGSEIDDVEIGAELISRWAEQGHPR